MIAYHTSLHSHAVKASHALPRRRSESGQAEELSPLEAESADFDIELGGRGNAHMYALDENPAEWAALVQLTQQLLQA